MTRQSFLTDGPWNDVYEEAGIRSQVFGLQTITNPAAARYPDVVAYPEHGYAWVATRDPEFPLPEHSDEGIIARFELSGDAQATS